MIYNLSKLLQCVNFASFLVMSPILVVLVYRDDVCTGVQVNINPLLPK